MHNHTILTLKPIFLVCSFVGLSPVKITKNGELIPNFCGVIKTIIALISHTFTLFYIDTTLRIYPRENLLSTILDVQDTAWGLFTLIIVLMELIRRKRIIKLLYDLEKCSSDLQCFGTKFNISLCYQCIQNEIRKAIVLLGITSTMATYFDYTLDTKFEIVMFLCTVWFYLCFLVTLPFFVLKFVLINILITARIQDINDIVNKCVSEHKFVVSEDITFLDVY